MLYHVQGPPLSLRYDVAVFLQPQDHWREIPTNADTQDADQERMKAMATRGCSNPALPISK